MDRLQSPSQLVLCWASLKAWPQLRQHPCQAAKMANVPAAFVTAQNGKVMAAHGLTVLAATEISMRLQTELSTRLQTTNSDGSSSIGSSGFSAFSAFSESPLPSSRCTALVFCRLFHLKGHVAGQQQARLSCSRLAVQHH